MKTFDIIINKILNIDEISSKVGVVELYEDKGVIFCEIFDKPKSKNTHTFYTDTQWEVKTDSGAIPVRIIIAASNAGIPFEDSIFYDGKIWVDKVKDILQFYLFDCKF